MTERSIYEQLIAYRRVFEELLERREAECETYANATPYEQELWSSKRAQLARLADIDHAQRKINLLDAALERVTVGQYGSCSCCGAPIDITRLTADPADPHCTNCALRFERTFRPKSIDAGIACEAMVVQLGDDVAILALPTGEHGSLSLDEIAEQPLGQLHEYLCVGDIVRVKSLGKDGSGQARLTMKMSRQVAA
jgi:RNA polymerase-binding transcription factor DksA